MLMNGMKSISGGDWVQIVLQFLQMAHVGGIKDFVKQVMGGSPTAETQKESGAAVTTAAEGGRGTADEHHYLIAAAQLHFGKTYSELSNRDRERIPAEFRLRRLNRIFQILREKNLNAGAEKLMHIIGKESQVFVKKRKQQSKPGGKQQKGQGHQQQQQTEEVFDEMPERVNPSGHFILLFLTDIEPEEAAEHLEMAAVSDTTADKAAAAARGVKSKFTNLKEGLKEIADNNDTRLHLLIAWLISNRKTVKQFLEGEQAKDLIQQIENAPTKEEKKRLNEELQRHLIKWVKDANSTASRLHQAKLDGQWFLPETKRRRSYIFIAVVVIGGILFVLY